MNSILLSIKKLLGIAEDYDHFDPDLILCINSVLMTLSDIGVGPDSVKTISSDTDTWEQLVGTRNDMEDVKTYVYLKVKMLFDPPQSSSHIEAINRQIAETEWRLNVRAEKEES